VLHMLIEVIEAAGEDRTALAFALRDLPREPGE